MQPAAQAKYPFLASPNAAGIDPFITTIYQNLFNHAPDANGLAFWHNYLAANLTNTFAIGQFIGFIINGATGPDVATLTNKVTVAAFTTTTYAANNITSFTPTSPPGAFSVAQIASVDGTAASVTAAQAQITAFAKNGATTNVFLTTGVDSATSGFSNSSTGTPVLNGFTATLNNTVVSGTFGGAGATWTPGDQVIAATGTTGQVLNITGNGTIGLLNVTGMATNKVTGFQTANILANTAVGAIQTEAVQGDFTASGPMGAWTGLTQLTVNSGSNLAFVDNLKADVTTNVNITDTNTAGTNSPMLVTGGLVDTINETNLAGANGGINVTGLVGTTTVSITQTETAVLQNGIVKIADANGASTSAAGTITTITLDGLSHSTAHTFTSPGAGLVLQGLLLNTIVDNALTTLTINHVDLAGAGVSITDNLTTPTAITLTLNLLADGINPATGFGMNNARERAIPR